MRLRLVSILALPLFAACATTHTVGDIYTGPATALYTETQACAAGTCNGTAPSFSAGIASNGASLNGVTGYRVQICPVAGQTISGAGTMDAYFCDSRLQSCSKTPLNAQPVTAATTSGNPCYSWKDFIVPYVSGNAQDTVEFVANGVTVSGGATLTERILTFQGGVK